MKELILTSATLLCIGLTTVAQNGGNGQPFFTSAPSRGLKAQDLNYEVRGTYTRPVKKQKLSTARFINDVILDYPKNWITSYASVEILATCGGRAMKAVSPNATLSAEQKKILNAADLTTDVVINVKYAYKDPVTSEVESSKIHVAMTVIPDTEAEYVGGYQQMTKYLKENAINKISGTIPKEFKQAIVSFTINEEGELANAKISRTSTDLKTDKLLLEAITKMPKWKPAQSAAGIKVKQEFEFILNGPLTGGC